ncbi:tRNA (adenosine(37)-N6)-threonylcarbamoyltransferase complex transferase subunit TsaD [Candidatus Gottesmanbacteria bacterium]|nr:tRNA (adenosine(37)-N6)-threonylcarbamoyltransferase complex transferase subunit TsaD [Candidatus Gottesmanbacteria bacterium]
MRILAIETSCDETAAAVVQDGTKIISNIVASSTKMHEKYGGIVPEVAAREQLRFVIPVIKEALAIFTKGAMSLQYSEQAIRQCVNDHIDSIAVTVGPGLIGSLLVGVETAKTIAYITGKPIIPVNHVLAHMYANFLDFDLKISPSFPAISLVASGGHTELYLMKSMKDLIWLGGTLDDAAGECFDKTARLLGFGHGGGLAIQNAAAKYSTKAKSKIHLPRPMLHDDTLNFSFSGLKTAVMREWKKNGNSNTVNEFAHEIQESISDVLVEKTLRAAKKYNAQSILLSGGVAANTCLRKKFKGVISFFTPSVELCTDNAAYIASYAYFRGAPAEWHNITAIPDLSVEDI